ncbi:MAG: DsbA-like protein thioredoxin domain-containing protein [Candidatus Wolfebacteria bacterium GW2011_GWE2_47_12]|nr:MAG: DsbA-like protein thioredoxin domain-containing protein [Candidatus Wolfebacteria bacterium GW2011_GWE2_47_12]
MIWVLIAIGLTAIVLGMYAAVVTPAQTDNANTETLATPVAMDEQRKGSESAKVTIVEYSDFQCPACQYYYNMTKQLERERGDQVQFIFRHFPLQSHQHARTAAIAAEAAGRQGRFWEMHDMLFERQEEWSKSDDARQFLTGYATLIGLDVGKFVGDAQLPELDERIDSDIAEGTKQQIQGTPTFYLNGRVVQFRSYEELQQLVDAELNK